MSEIFNPDLEKNLLFYHVGQDLSKIVESARRISVEYGKLSEIFQADKARLLEIINSIQEILADKDTPEENLLNVIQIQKYRLEMLVGEKMEIGEKMQETTKKAAVLSSSVVELRNQAEACISILNDLSSKLILKTLNKPLN
jgi:hypothetical protein